MSAIAMLQCCQMLHTFDDTLARLLLTSNALHSQRRSHAVVQCRQKCVVAVAMQQCCRKCAWLLLTSNAPHFQRSSLMLAKVWTSNSRAVVSEVVAYLMLAVAMPKCRRKCAAFDNTTVSSTLSAQQQQCWRWQKCCSAVVLEVVARGAWWRHQWSPGRRHGRTHVSCLSVIPRLDLSDQTFKKTFL